jgi:hypothetical protein
MRVPPPHHRNEKPMITLPESLRDYDADHHRCGKMVRLFDRACVRAVEHPGPCRIKLPEVSPDQVSWLIRKAKERL